MITAAVTPPIAIATSTNVLNVFLFGLAHLVEVLDELVAHLLEVVGEMVAFCATVEEAIVTEVEVRQLGPK